MSELDPILAALNRIATAFEEQNRINLEHIAWLKTCHDETEALTEHRYQVTEARVEMRYQQHVKHQEEEATRLQHWHDEAERLTAQRQQEQVEREEMWRGQLMEELLAEFKGQGEVKL